MLPAPRFRGSLGAGSESKERIATSLPKSSIVLSAPSSSTSNPFVPQSLSRKPRQSSASAFNQETGMMSAVVRSSKKRDPKPSPESNDSSDEEGAPRSNFFSLDSNPLSNPLGATSISAVSSLPSVTSKEDDQILNQPLIFKGGVKPQTVSMNPHTVEAASSSAMAGPIPRPSGGESYGYPLPDPSDESSFQHDAEVCTQRMHYQLGNYLLYFSL